MSIWHVAALLAAIGAIASLVFIYRAIDRLAQSVSSVCSQLTKINAKLESVQAVSGEEDKKLSAPVEPDLSFEAIETALANFEKLKRIDLTES